MEEEDDAETAELVAEAEAEPPVFRPDPALLSDTGDAGAGDCRLDELDAGEGVVVWLGASSMD